MFEVLSPIGSPREVSSFCILVHFAVCGFGVSGSKWGWLALGFGPAGWFLQVNLSRGSDGTDKPLDVLGHRSGWVACFLVEVGPFFGVPKGRLPPRFGWVLLFVSAQFAVLGVIADSEYVDCMGNNRTSTLYGTLVDLEY